LKVAYVTTYDPTDVLNWSGVGTYIARALQSQGITLEPVIVRQEPFFPIAKAHARNIAARLFSGKRYLVRRSPEILRSYAQQVQSALHRHPVDLVFSPGTLPISALEIDLPIAFWTDATFASMLGFYSQYANISGLSIQHANRADQSALSRASAAIYASRWAADSAIENYDVNPDLVHVVPFGPNVEWAFSPAEVERFVAARPADHCNLLFMGVDWDRKGGDLAVAAAERLVEAGVKVRLDIVGCQPPRTLPLFARLHGFMSKQTPEGMKQILSLMREAHFLLLPSRAEAFGVVAVEAASVAVPTLACKVGGLAEVVRDGVTGYGFGLDASPEEYAEKILNNLHPQVYRQLALSAYSDYLDRLNWRTAGERAAAIIRKIG
jgi:glycosyltransferase involved in cell wall biosynthesis